MDRPGFLGLRVLLGLAWTQLGTAAAQQAGVVGCPLLDPGAIAGIVLVDLLLTLLIALAVYYVAKRISQRQQAGNGNIRKTQPESHYEELQGHRLDIYSDLKNTGATYK
ncbi:TYRO protein tyrosine kinase-binding protein [Elgaria multicarinata webbii]|uniref:TYRO protein tyrosine kinase-binding protein n=1 Tax=Elgaria multicarinata webbii TaxID=159646 RepID=UPI002FCCC852